MIKLLIIIFFFPNFLNSQQIVNNKKNGKPIEIFAEQGIEWHKNEKNIWLLVMQWPKVVLCL